MILRKPFGALCSVALAFLVYPSHAMPTLGEDDAATKVVDARIAEQNAAFLAGDFTKAYKLNLALEKPIRKMRPIKPQFITALLVDRAVFLDRLGRRPQAQIILEKIYKRDGFESLLTDFNADYYTHAVEYLYTSWLSETDKPRADLVRDVVAQRILSAELNRQTLYAMQYPVGSIDRLRRLGRIDAAAAQCVQIFDWLAKFDVRRYGIFQAYHGTIFVDKDDAFVTELGFRSGPHDMFFQYLTADANDSCAAINEHEGKLDLAIMQRLNSYDAILKSDQATFARVIDLRLARLYAFADKPDLSLYHFERAWQVYAKDTRLELAEEQLCRDLKFYYDGSAMLFTIDGVAFSPSEVWKRLANTTPLNGKPLEFECAD